MNEEARERDSSQSGDSTTSPERLKDRSLLAGPERRGSELVRALRILVEFMLSQAPLPGAVRDGLRLGAGAT